MPIQVEIVTSEQKIVWPVHKNRNFYIKTDFGEMEICINRGSVHVVSSSCPDQICVKAGKIRQEGQMIICAPNRIVIRMISLKPSRRFRLLTY